MIGRIYKYFRGLRKKISRSHLMLQLLKRPQSYATATEPGLVMLQIDGLSHEQFHTAMKKNRLPFLKHLIQTEKFTTAPFYSGVPSTTPAVQGEIFYGVKTIVPAFEFVRRKTGDRLTMYMPDSAEKIGSALDEKGEPLLKDGAAYSNVFAAGADEARYCAQTLDIESVLKAVNPVKVFLVFFVHLPRIFRILVYATIELILAVYDFLRGIMERRNLFKELTFIPSRIAICIILRELIRFHVKMDVTQGVKIVHANLLGYDEQAHRRGPSSAFAHWTLKGIDDVIKDIYHTARRSDCRDYQMIVYSDHGQEAVDTFASVYGKPVGQAIKEVFSETHTLNIENQQIKPVKSLEYLHQRARHIFFGESDADSAPASGGPDQIQVAATGPLGHIYLPFDIPQKEKMHVARRLVTRAGIPLVLFKAKASVTAINDKGVFDLPADAEQVLGKSHPFLQVAAADLSNLCHHRDAGDMVISGWRVGHRPISFAIERGAHGGPGAEETRGVAVLPMAAGFAGSSLRGADLRKHAIRLLESEKPLSIPIQKTPADDFRLRVASYNIHSCISMDGKIFPGRVARVIADLDPDIIALQEVDVDMQRTQRMDQARFLAQRLQMEYRFFPVIDNREGKYGLALLSRYPVLDINGDLLPVLSRTGKRETRGIMRAKIKTPGGVIDLLNTHLSFDGKEGLLQVNALIKGQRISAEQSEPLILCGDLNAGPRSPAYRRLSDRLLDVQSMNNRSGPPKPTFFSGYPLMRIDHIFVSKHFRSLRVRTPRSYDSRMASDHLPVLAELSWKRGENT